MSDPKQGWADELLHFWFAELKYDQYWTRDETLDRDISGRFLPYWQALHPRPTVGFAGDSQIARAAVLLFDQVPRNAFRDDPRAFSSDPLARQIAAAAIVAGWDEGLASIERQFLYMPFMHSEVLADQDRSVALFASLGDPEITEFADKHRAMIVRFGRFPHRNTFLGRESTPAEREAVAAGNAW